MVPESTSPGVLLGNSTHKALTLLDEFKTTEIRDLMKAQA